MRYSFLTLYLLLAGCEDLWKPACLDNPGLRECQLSYQPATSYLAPGSKQTLLLRAEGLVSHQAEFLNAHKSGISAILQYRAFEQDRDIQLEIKEILPNGDILIRYPMPQDLVGVQSRIMLRIGNVEPIQMNMKNVSIGCSLMTDYPKIVLGYNSNQSQLSRTYWTGFQINSERTSFIMKRTVDDESFGSLYRVHYDNANKKFEEGPSYFSRVDLMCQTLAAKNITLEFCPPMNSKDDQSEWRFHLLDPNSFFSKSCAMENNIFCGDFSKSLSQASSAKDNLVAISDLNNLHILSFKISLNINVNEVKVSLKEINASHIERLIFFDIDFDGREDLIGLDIMNQAFVYKNYPESFLRSKAYEAPLMAALNRINEQDSRPVSALAIGNLYGDNTSTLLVAKDKDLWIGGIASETESPESQPSLAYGSLRLKDAFPQPPERLEIVDLNGDGIQDIVAVTANAAYLCPTLVAGE